jgi:G6PDH family F420-dependent oxidoreductase
MFKISYDVGPVGAWFEPTYSLEIGALAEKAGFDAIWFGDHVLPWFHTHAHVPQAWVWIATALERTCRIPVGSDVTVPMFKYHPIVVAQAFATMARIHPGRVLFGVGTGEAINEAPFLDSNWPNWKVRAETLTEAITLIRRFWSSEEYFDFYGQYFKVKGIFCYDKPKKQIPIYFSAFGPKSARLAGQIADHLMTAWGNADALRSTLIPNFEQGLKMAGKVSRNAERVMYIDGGYGNLRRLVKKFRIHAGSLIPENTNEMDPRKIEASAVSMRDEEILEKACLTESPCRFIERIEESIELGFNHIIFADWGYDPATTLKMFSRQIIPILKKRKRK